MTTSDTLNITSEEILDDLDGRFLTFYIDENFYGVELLHVIEIISIQPITPVPQLPAYIKGIINLRGKVVPVISVRSKFSLPEREYDDKTCIIVVTIEEMQVGLIVDSVAEVITVPRNQQATPPEFGASNSDKYLRSIAKVGGKVVLNIDCDKFFHADVQLF